MVNYYEFLDLNKDDLITDEIVNEKINIMEIAAWEVKNNIARLILKAGNNEVKVNELKEARKEIDDIIKIIAKARTDIGTEAARRNYNKLLEEIEKNGESTEQSYESEKDIEDVYSTERMRAESEKFMDLVRRINENNKNRIKELNQKRQELNDTNLTMEQLKEKHKQNHEKSIEEFEQYQDEITRIKYGMDLDEKKVSKLAKLINDGKQKLKDKEEKFKAQKKSKGHEIGDE